MPPLKLAFTTIGHGAIDYIVMLLFVLVTIWIGMTKPERILYILPAATTFHFFVNFGIELTPFKVVPLLLIIVTALNGKRKYFSIKGNSWIYIAFAWVMISFVWGILIALAMDFFGFIQSPLKRQIVQFIGYFNFVCVYLVAKKECADKEKFYLFVKSFIFTTTILCAYGIVQIFCYKFGIPFRWVVYGENQEIFNKKLAALQNPEDILFRINSFANEPKRLSYVLPLAIFMIVGIRKVIGDAFMTKRNALLLIVLHMFCTFMTYSTSLYFALAMFFPVIFFMGIVRNTHRNYTKFLIYALIGIVITSPLYIDLLLKLYELRVTAQLKGLEVIQWKRAEQFAMEALALAPWSAITGVGLGGWNFLFTKLGLQGYFLMGRGFMQMNSALLIMLFDMGIVGVAIFYTPIINVFIGYKSIKNPILKELYAPIILFFFFVSFFLTTNVLYFLILGAFDGIRQNISDFYPDNLKKNTTLTSDTHSDAQT